MIAVCDRCKSVCNPSQVEGYTYECLCCDEDLYAFEVTEYDDDTCEEMYLEYLNNFISLGGFASYHGLPDSTAKEILKHGKEVFRSR